MHDAAPYRGGQVAVDQQVRNFEKVGFLCKLLNGNAWRGALGVVGSARMVARSSQPGHAASRMRGGGGGGRGRGQDAHHGSEGSRDRRR